MDKNEATAQLLHFKRQWAQHIVLILCGVFVHVSSVEDNQELI